MLRHRLTPALATALLALGAAGCGGSGGDSGSGGGEDPQVVVDRGDPRAGEAVFAESCAGCHGDDANGGTGPKLAGNPDVADPDLTVEQIREGGGGMPGFAGQLDDDELADVAAYVVKTLPEK